MEWAPVFRASLREVPPSVGFARLIDVLGPVSKVLKQTDSDEPRNAT